MLVEQQMDTASPSSVDAITDSMTGTTVDTVTASTTLSVVESINYCGVGASIPFNFEPTIDVTAAATTTTTTNDVCPSHKKKRKHPIIQYRRTFKEPFKFPKLRALTPDSDECMW